MSMSTMLRQKEGKVSPEDVELAIQGNLCRCTGYRPIVEGFRTLCQGGAEQVGRRPNHLLGRGLDVWGLHITNMSLVYTLERNPSLNSR